MNIIISNDDGINARGIHELAKALREGTGANIYIFAPATQMSATGHGITLGKPIKLEEREFEGVEYAMAISGTPADCVKIGIEYMNNNQIPVDMIFSGINMGGNLGTDTLYSGTVSAAMEGSFGGINSVAVSVNSHGAEHFDYACELAVKAAKQCDKQEYHTVLNINVPNLPKAEVKGLLITRLGDKKYNETFDRTAAEDGTITCIYRGDPVVYSGLPIDVDVIADQEGYASITPIHRDLTQYEMINELKGWDF